MNFFKVVTLLSLFGLTKSSEENTYQDPNVGHCPYAPGELDSKMKQNIDYTKLLGPWINLVDELEIRGAFKCYGYRLDLISDNIVSYSQSMDIAEETRNHMKKVGHPHAHDKYFLEMGR